MSGYQYIQKGLQRKAFLIRFYRILNGLFSFLILGLLLAGMGLALTTAFPGRSLVLFGYGILSWSLLLPAALALLVVFFRPLALEKVALLLERRYPDLEGELISALQLGRDREVLVEKLGLSEGMIESLLEKVGRSMPEIIRRPVINRKAFMGNLALLLVLFLTNLGALHFSGGDYRQVMSLMADPMKYYPFSKINLEVSPGNVRILEGGSLEITVALEGHLPGRMILETRPAGSQDSGLPLEMVRKGPLNFGRTMDRVMEPLSYRAVHPRASSPWYSVEVSLIPRAGDLSLELMYPPYTGLESISQEGSGHVKGYRGTVVKWRARANKDLERASLALSSGEEFPLAVEEGANLRGEMVITGGGHYRVDLLDREGFSNPRPDEYDITIIPDEFPVVELLIPQGDLEVDGASLVDLFFTARDDFGLTVSSLVYQLPDGSSRRLRISDAGGNKIHQKDYSWDLGALGLEPGERVNYHVEVLDNDSLSGPKAGISVTRTIIIKDSRAVHQELSELEREVLEEFIDLLGDELEIYDAMTEMEELQEMGEEAFMDGLREVAASQERATGDFDRSMEKLNDYLEQASQDVLMSPSSLFMKGLAERMLQEVLKGEEAEGKQLDELVGEEDMSPRDKASEASWMAGKKDERISMMEKAISLMQESSRYQNMQEAMDTQERLLGEQMDLIDRLEEMSGEMTPETAGEMARMVQEIARMLSELMKQLVSMADELPEEFVNADAMTELPFDDLFETLQEMADALSRGDLEEAMKKAEELLKSLSDMMQRLQEAARQLESLLSRSAEEFRKQKEGELQKLVREQRDILEKTEGVARERERRIREDRRRQKEEFLRTLAEEMANIQQSLDESQKAVEERPPDQPLIPGALPALKSQLELLRRQTARQGGEVSEALLQAFEKNIRQARIGLEEAVPEDRTAGTVEQNLNRVLESLDRVSGARPGGEIPSATPGEEGFLEMLSERQGEVRERTGALAEKIEALSKVIPVISPELNRSLEEAAGFMEDARGELAGYRPAQAVPPEREALFRLQQAQSSAAQSMYQMEKMAGLQQRGGSALKEVGQMFGFMPLPSMTPSMGEREGGRLGVSVRNFKIPGKEEFEVPKIIREEIMESMEAGYPSGFEKALREYYRRISE